MTFAIDLAALLDRASKRAAQQGYPATPATRLPEPTAEGSQVATVAGYPAPEKSCTHAGIEPTKPGFVGFVGPIRECAQEISRPCSLPEALAAAVNRACEARGDDDVNRAGLLADCAALPPEGQADMLAHFLIEAARWVAPAPDPRVTCSTCAHYRPHRCGNHKAAGLQGRDIAADFAVLLHRCPGWMA